MLNHKLICCACFVLLAAVLVNAEEEATVVKVINQQNLDGAGQYRHEVEVDNGIRISAEGNVNGEHGEYFLPSKDGEPPKRVTYIADSTGFHPTIHD